MEKENKNFNKEDKRELQRIMNVLAMNYRDNKIKLYYCGPNNPITFEEKQAARDIRWVESTYRALDDKYQPIILVDVLKKFSGLKINDIMSDAHYNRYKYLAYEAFRIMLDRLYN